MAEHRELAEQKNIDKWSGKEHITIIRSAWRVAAISTAFAFARLVRGTTGLYFAAVALPDPAGILCTFFRRADGESWRAAAIDATKCKLSYNAS